MTLFRVISSRVAIMSKAISFKDVIKCLNYLGHEAVSEIHLLPKSMDETVNQSFMN